VSDGPASDRQTTDAGPAEARPRRRTTGAFGAPLRPENWRELREAARRRLPAPLLGKILYLERLTVSFDGFKALDNLSLILDPGELRCIIGANGAGKTTMMDVITGRTRPDSGRVYMDGQTIELTRMSEFEIARKGVGRKFQRPTVFEQLSTFENLELACRADKRVFRTLFARLSKGQRERIESALETIGLAAERDTRAGLLSHGQKQWLEIGMLLVQDPKVMLIDEPVAGMTHQEIDRTAELLVGLAGARTVVVVEHDMEFVRRLARTVTVLHEGRVLAEGTMDEVQSNPKVIEVYLGS
jgi:urea transport system ATP-binding protein